MKKWELESLKAAILSHGLVTADIKDIQHGQQIILRDGTKANWYMSGKVVIQGKDSEEKNLLISVVHGGTAPIAVPIKSDESMPSPASIVKEPKVFVVYGHDTETRDQLELMLLRMNIKPVILGNVAPDGKTIIEALIANTDVPYAVVLLTPDDEGYKAGLSDQKAFRARQNVVLEMGMFLSKLGRERVAILHKGNLELPSDIHGLIYIPFKISVQEAKNKLAASLQKAGFYIDIEHLSAE
ncbi:MAG: nucleotide-binding protein [Nitrosomonas sp.]|uniref:TIR domain-containing protein n=1 Tax=Nitrosomonas sp. TaxID=42353 RepID=UPI001D9F9AD8|nr:TIR domain-containing protein [Nitrosomonas sp.]MBX9894291.1 nucleotide-binding protein [Nitrosomonas sp.]